MSDLREALAELYEWCRGLNDFRPDSNLARRVQSALSAQPQPEAVEPVAYTPISKAPRSLGEPVWKETFAAKWRSKDVWKGFELRPLYTAPPLAPDERMRRALDKEVAAQAIYEHWANYPACSSKPWSEICEKLPEQANDFRRKGRAVIEALSRADEGKESEGDPRAPQWLPKASQELYFKHDWCPTCHRGWEFKPSPSDPTPAEQRETIARIIYDAFPFAPTLGCPYKPAWREGGNSFMQNDARRAADRILARG